MKGDFVVEFSFIFYFLEKKMGEDISPPELFSQRNHPYCELLSIVN